MNNMLTLSSYLLLAQPTSSHTTVAIWLENAGKPLLILHALTAILLLGTMTHNSLLTVRYLWGHFHKVKLEKLYVKVGLIAYLLTFGLGAIIYPNYRYHVRERFFDPHMPWASHLFDIKEHWTAIGLILFTVFYLLSRELEPERHRQALFFYVFLSLCLCLIVWFSLISGLLLSSYRSI
jgi:hypothetical protein